MDDPQIQRAHESALRSIAKVVEHSVEPTDPVIAQQRIASWFQQGDVAVVTGAGVSTDSGIPDYRGPRGSLRRSRPMTYQEFLYDEAARRRYWARSFVGWRVMAQAVPNRTHYGLVELQRAGHISGIITQNVDGLHAQAGADGVIALHGDLATVCCLQCHYRFPRVEMDARLQFLNPGYLERARSLDSEVNPDGDVELAEDFVDNFVMTDCPQCGSQRLKPDVVYFGEPVPTQWRQAAIDLVDRSRAVVAVGSSLAVMSGFQFILRARKAGKPVGIINGGPSRADDRADVVWRTMVAPAIDALLDDLSL